MHPEPLAVRIHQQQITILQGEIAANSGETVAELKVPA